MFEMEINEITFKQARAFNAFHENAQMTHKSNNMNVSSCGKWATEFENFQHDNFSTMRETPWDSKQNPQALLPKVFLPDNQTHQGESGRGHIFCIKQLGEKIFKRKCDDNEKWAESPGTDIDSPKENSAYEKRSLEFTNIYEFLSHDYGKSSNEQTDAPAEGHNSTLKELNSKILHSRTLIMLKINTTHLKADSVNKKLNNFLHTSNKMLDRYIDIVMDTLFNITEVVFLAKEVKDILDVLNIIRCIGRQQHAVLDPFARTMFSRLPTRLGNHVGELYISALATYNSLRDLLDLKQKQASVIEARSARKEVKASSDQAEEFVSLAYGAVRQGRSIMLFTIVTIIFLPLSFFTSLFGMNAKKRVNGDFTFGSSQKSCGRYLL
ncbi:hypothetical protein B0O99DRAFT_603206 [Bisporella sp. PMI_857]|nr:hypothetical protein B0O99DRAFT_603206 [Bisporella sp. PMI_857]